MVQGRYITYTSLNRSLIAIYLSLAAPVGLQHLLPVPQGYRVPCRPKSLRNQSLLTTFSFCGHCLCLHSNGLNLQAG